MVRLCVACMLLVACKREREAAIDPVRVAAASDLSGAFEALKTSFDGGLELSFGASGMLATQLAAGAPYDVFAAANTEYVEKAVKAGACDGATVQKYARGRLAVFSTSGAAKLEALGDERFKRIAIANPDTAPYGRAAKEALTAAGLWERVSARLVFGESVRQTLQLAQTGNVDAALVAHSLVMGSDKATLVDEQLHAPLLQAVALCKGGKNAEGGRRFIALLRSEQGVEVLKRYGLEPP
jgi:molybdate transport system substrate-binding protein